MKRIRHAWVMVIWAVVCSFVISAVSAVPAMAAETAGKPADTSGKPAADPGRKPADTSGKPAVDTSGKAPDISGKPASSTDKTAPAKAKPKTVTGMVEKTDKGMILKARGEIYTVTGKDLSSLVGKKVKVTGTLTKTDKGNTFHVMRAQEIKPTKPLQMRR
jgi:hypothetical protein